MRVYLLDRARIDSDRHGLRNGDDMGTDPDCVLNDGVRHKGSAEQLGALHRKTLRSTVVKIYL